MYAQQDDTHRTRILKYGLGSLRGPGRTLITCVSRVSNLGKEGCSEAYLRLDGGPRRLDIFGRRHWRELVLSWGGAQKYSWHPARPKSLLGVAFASSRCRPNWVIGMRAGARRPGIALPIHRSLNQGMYLGRVRWKGSCVLCQRVQDRYCVVHVSSGLPGSARTTGLERIICVARAAASFQPRSLRLRQ